MFFLPVLLITAGIGLFFVLSTTKDRPVPQHEPETVPVPGQSTGYPHVDAILDELRHAAAQSGVPLGLLVGWIAKESGGKLSDTTSLDERGYFQLMPKESEALKLDHQRLSTDPEYSIYGGLLLIASYMKAVDQLGVAPKGSSYYWNLVKLYHSMGSSAAKKVVTQAQAAGQAGSWQALESWALANNSDLLHQTKHAPAKWFPFVDEVARVGAPFGYGTTAVAGDYVGLSPPYKPKFTDIPDPLDCLKAV